MRQEADRERRKEHALPSLDLLRIREKQLLHEAREVRIAHVTLHVSVAQALRAITTGKVLQTIQAVDTALKKLGIAEPRIAVSGVNPHAGESGAFGREEIDIVDPAIQEARRAGITVDGPIGADTLIQRAGKECRF